MLNVTYKPFMVIVFMLSVVNLNVIMLSVMTLFVVQATDAKQRPDSNP